MKSQGKQKIGRVVEAKLQAALDKAGARDIRPGPDGRYSRKDIAAALLVGLRLAESVELHGSKGE